MRGAVLQQAVGEAAGRRADVQAAAAARGPRRVRRQRVGELDPAPRRRSAGARRRAPRRPRATSWPGLGRALAVGRPAGPRRPSPRPPPGRGSSKSPRSVRSVSSRTLAMGCANGRGSGCEDSEAPTKRGETWDGGPRSHRRRAERYRAGPGRSHPGWPEPRETAHRWRAVSAEEQILLCAVQLIVSCGVIDGPPSGWRVRSTLRRCGAARARRVLTALTVPRLAALSRRRVGGCGRGGGRCGA